MTDREYISEITDRVSDCNGNVFYVGGCVRDEIIGIESHDFDIEVYGIMPDKLKAILNDLGEIHAHGALFGIYEAKGHNVDISQPRKYEALFVNDENFEDTIDPFADPKTAALRRDFTMNAIMKNAKTGELLDYFGGMDDIKNKTIRCVSDDTFKIDPLRVLRAAEFSSRLGFEIESRTKQLMADADISELPKERVFAETRKALMNSEKPSVYFNILKEVDQLSAWYPELKACIGAEQNPDYHPEGDVWTHTMEVIDAAAKYRSEVNNPEKFMFAALCHDLGKPAVATINAKGNITHIGHETEGVDIARSFLSRLSSDKSLHEYALNMTKMHMRPHVLYSANARYKKTNAMFDVSVDGHDLAYLAAADDNNRVYDSDKYIDWMKDRYDIYKSRIQEPMVKGQDLIDMGIKPGPIFNDILSNTRKQHLSGVDKENVLKDVRSKMRKQGMLSLDDSIVSESDSIQPEK